MKRLVIICIAAIICVAIFAAPLYYTTFFKVEAAPEPQATATAEVKSKYLIVGFGDSAVILNQDTGEVYKVYGRNVFKCDGSPIQ